MRGGPPEPDAVLVRHGQTAWSLAGRHTGTTDVPLTDDGRAQAARAGTRLAGHAFALVLTSPRQRARDTCALAGLAGQARVDDDLAEWDYGDFEGLTSNEIEARTPGWSLWRDGCPGGEQPAQVAARADRVIMRCLAAGGDVAVFAHGHILRVLGARWVGFGAAAGAALALATASVSTLGWEHHAPAITSWNDTAHLDARWSSGPWAGR